MGKETVQMNAITIGLDIGKSSFQVHGVDATGAVALRRKLPRSRVLALFGTLAPAVVGIEACASGQYWAREIGALGHTVRLMPARAVKAYLPRQKNDAADAAAICEAAGRPGIVRSVPVKSVEAQSVLSLLRVRELLLKQRTMLVNALRGHLAEFGKVAPRGRAGVAALTALLSENELPEAVRLACTALQSALAGLEAQVVALDAALRERHRQDRQAQRLAEIPGIGLMGATALSVGTRPAAFKTARDYTASLGLVPGQHSTGGKARLGSITRMGDGRVRRRLVLGASALLKRLRPRNGVAPAALAASALGAWALRLLAHKSWRVAMVALANKLARIAWAVLTRAEAYRPHATPPTAVAA